MRKNDLRFLLVLSIFLLFSCKNDDNNPITPNSNFSKVVITDKMDSSYKLIINFDNINLSTNPEKNHFLGKSLYDVWSMGFVFNEYYYKYYGNLGNITDFQFLKDGNLFVATHYKYNNNGLLIEDIIGSSHTSQKKEYVYNHLNKLTEIVEDKDYFGNFQKKMSFFYGENGYINKFYMTFGYDSDTLMTSLVHNEEGYLLKSTEIYISDNNILDTSAVIEYFYNNIGQLEKTINTDMSSIPFYVVINEFEYNSNGKISKTKDSYTGSLWSTAEYIYNDNNYLIESNYYNSNNVLTGNLIYKYE